MEQATEGGATLTSYREPPSTPSPSLPAKLSDQSFHRGQWPSQGPNNALLLTMSPDVSAYLAMIKVIPDWSEDFLTAIGAQPATLLRPY